MSIQVPDEIRTIAREIRTLLDRHQEIAIAMNSAAARHDAAQGQLVSGLSAEALRGIYGPQGPDLGLSGKKPPVLADPSPVSALERVSRDVRGSFYDLHRLAEDSRVNAAEVGQLMERMTSGLVELGLTRADAQRVEIDEVAAGELAEPAP